MPDSLLTLDAAAEVLALSRRTIEREISAGRLAVVRIRGAVRVAQSDLDGYIVRLRRYQEQSDPCPSANVVTFGTSASRSAGSELSALLDEALPGRMRPRLRRFQIHGCLVAFVNEALNFAIESS